MSKAFAIDLEEKSNNFMDKLHQNETNQVQSPFYAVKAINIKVQEKSSLSYYSIAQKFLYNSNF